MTLRFLSLARGAGDSFFFGILRVFVICRFVIGVSQKKMRYREKHYGGFTLCKAWKLSHSLEECAAAVSVLSESHARLRDGRSVIQARWPENFENCSSEF
jgi:hypothetical protein